jgi:hypothetical protein
LTMKPGDLVKIRDTLRVTSGSDYLPYSNYGKLAVIVEEVTRWAGGPIRYRIVCNQRTYVYPISALELVSETR